MVKTQFSWGRGEENPSSWGRGRNTPWARTTEGKVGEGN